MKTVYLLRHAKSSWDEPTISDFERPLNKRGEKSAPVIGKELKERKVKPDVVVCSPARRTRQTAKLALKAAKLDAEVVFDARVYLAEVDKLLAIIKELDDGAKSVLLIGHNPGLEDLLLALTGQSAPMVTAALAAVSLDIKSWADLRERKGKLDWLVTARELISD